MKRTSIPQQLKLDYPGRKISFDNKRSLLLIDEYKVGLLLDEEELEHIHVHTKSGKNFYQAITQLIYSKYQLTPAKSSYAETLITFKEEYEKFRVQNLAEDYGIGFLEDGDEVIAVKITGDMEKPVLIEEDEKIDPKLISDPADYFGYLIEVKEDED